jgi:hypothetical protein
MATSISSVSPIPLKPAGATPTIVKGVPSMRMERPTAAGSRLKCRCQNACPITAIGVECCVATLTSASESTRPVTG